MLLRSCAPRSIWGHLIKSKIFRSIQIWRISREVDAWAGELKTGPKTQKLQVHRAAGPKNLNQIYGRSSHNTNHQRATCGFRLSKRGSITCSGAASSARYCFTYIGPTNGPIQRPNPVRYVQYECDETTARYETPNTEIGPCATRALLRLKNMAFKVLRMGT